MKKLIATMIAAATAFAYSQEAELPAGGAAENAPKWTDAFWGFGNLGIYSGYELYGSLVNPEPVFEGYVEGNFSLKFDDLDLGYAGIGTWFNTDLTDRRRNSLGKAFNEWGPNIHWGRTFWFDDGKNWGLDYRTSVVWHYYPPLRHREMWGSQFTTTDWVHSFALKNPFVVPFLDWVHEFHETDGDILQFGLKRDCPVDSVEGLTLTPSMTFVYRDHRYNWCFPTAGFTEFHNGGIATMKLMLDGTYKVNKNFGFFAKIAFCSIIDSDLRDASDHSRGDQCGKYKDYAWGGVGVVFNF